MHNMLLVVLTLFVIAVVLVVNEVWLAKKMAHKEHARKLIHIFVGSFAAFWPLYLSWNDIRLISLAFLIGILLSKSLNIFSSIHSVERFSLGEISFALVVGVLTFITTSRWIYAASLLQMSLADGVAAIVGVNYGRNNRYKVLGATKSLSGTIAFLVTSLIILFAASAINGGPISYVLLLVTALVATGVENLAIYGLDNIFLAVITALILTHF